MKKNKTTIKSEITIQPERWFKRNVITARDSKGRFVAWRRRTEGFTIYKARNIFKKNRTFNEDVKKTTLTNVIETTDFSGKKPSSSRAEKYQFFVETSIKDKIITARSMQYEITFPKEKAREEAIENLYARIHQSVNGLEQTGDEEEGKVLFDTIEEAKRNYKEGVVYYTARPA